MKILILEDNPDTAWTMVRLFNEVGHEAVVARTGEQGLHLLRTEQFDGALIDLLIPGKKNGWQFIDEMDAGGVKVPVIVVSGYSDVEPPSHHHRVPVVKKPYEFQELLQLVEHNFKKG